MLKDNLAYQEAKKNFTEATGLKFDWEKLEKKAIAADASDPGYGWLHALDEAVRDLTDLVIETAIENNGKLQQTLDNTLAIFNEKVMKTCFEIDLREDSKAYIEAYEKENNKKFVQFNTISKDSYEIQKADLNHEVNPIFSSKIEYYEFLDSKLNAFPATKVGLFENRYAKGKISIDDMLNFTRDKKPAENETLDIEDAKTLASYAKALENTNKNRSIISMLFHLPTHFKEKNAIEEIRAMATKSGKTIEELEALAETPNEYIMEQKADVEKSATPFIEKYNAQTELFQAQLESREAGAKNLKDTKMLAEIKSKVDALQEAYDRKYGEKATEKEQISVDLNEPVNTEVKQPEVEAIQAPTKNVEL